MHICQEKNKINNIKKRMRDMNITTKQIAQYIMLPNSIVQKVIDGNACISYIYMNKILELLNMDYQDQF